MARSLFTEIAPDPRAWPLGPGEVALDEYLGRQCLRFGEGFSLSALPEVRLAEGAIEVDLAVGAERSFHGVAWHVRDPDNYESFFVRPHQVGNPDAIQYTPVTNGISSWQLYHGDGFWAPIAFPIDAWFTIRVAFAGGRADLFLEDLAAPVLRVRELKLHAPTGGIGLLVGGSGLRVARFAYSPAVPVLSEPMPPQDPAAAGTITAWEVSDTFEEALLAGLAELPDALLRGRTWTPVTAEPHGLLDLARVNPIRDGRNAVLARTRINADAARLAPLEIGFSDRALVFCNGHALFRGDDTYRSRDYRFLGSIGFWDTVYLPLVAGENELVIAVAEDFGGWGVQARLV